MDSKGNIHTFKDSDELVKALARRPDLKPIERPLTRAERRTLKIGRNSPCGCGSGLKFKRCCYGK